MEQLFNTYGWGNKPQHRWWKIKNHDEMRDYIRDTVPEMIYNDTFLEVLTQIEMERLVEERMRLQKAIKELSDRTDGLSVQKEDSVSQDMKSLALNTQHSA
jgi:hypothetical protein